MIPSLLALAFAVVGLHLLYFGYIRPEAFLALEVAKQAGQSAPRDLVVILKDYEQEICLILMVWGMFLILEKCLAILKHRYLFNVDLLEGSSGDGSLKSVLTSLCKLPEKTINTPLVKILMSSLRRFIITNNFQSTSDAIESNVEALATKQ